MSRLQVKFLICCFNQGYLEKCDNDKYNHGYLLNIAKRVLISLIKTTVYAVI